MAFNNDDLFLVNRGGNSFKTEYGLLKTSINDGAGAIVSDEAPEDPNDGDLWYNSEDGRLYVYYVSETSGMVSTVGTRNAGSGYTTDQDNVSTTNATGQGSGLTLNIDAGVGGNFTNPQINNPGHAYEVGDIVYITGAGHGNGSVQVTAVTSEPSGVWVDASPDSSGGGSFGKDEADALYLSKENDDTAEGAITFEGLTTHEGGIEVTGGTGVHSVEVSAQANRPGAAFYAYNRLGEFPATNSCTQAIGYQSTLLARTDSDTGFTGEYAHFRCDIPASVTSTNSPEFSTFYGFHAGEGNQDQIRCSGTKAAFRCGWNTSSNASDTYNFYSAGNAPNYLGGTLRTGNVTATGGNTNDENNWSWTVNNTSSNGVRIYENGVSASLFTATATSACFASNRIGVTTGRHFDFRWRGSEVGDIRMNGSGANPTGIIYNAGGTATTGAAFVVGSDYRLKTNIVDAPSVSELVKQLQPRQFDMAEQVGAVGFVAHELQEVIPEAVVGEKDAVDEEGNAVIQGIDRSVLVPYLTKALQEVITKNEELEGRIAALEGGN